MRKVRGFTLIELMVVVAVVAILAGLAYNTYVDQIRKSRRSDAKQVLMDYANRQEKYRSNNATYYTGAINVTNPLLASPTMPNGFYTVALGTPSGTCANVTGTPAVSSSNSFMITATAVGAQAADTGCATLRITSTCGLLSKTSTGGATCW
jgi:type IV pilus assembly protein PilE